MRRLPPRELDRIVATVESDLERFPTKDSLLEHLARLHFDARARQEAIGLEEARRHPDSARRIVETAIFERRYGVKLTEALELGGPVADEESDQANLYVEGVLRRLGIVYQTLDRGRWLIESDGCAVYLQHYAGERVLDVYAPIMPLDRRRRPRRPLPRPARLQRRLDRRRLLRHLLVQRVRLAPLRLRPPGDRAPRRPRGRLRAQLGRRARRAPQRRLSALQTTD